MIIFSVAIISPVLVYFNGHVILGDLKNPILDYLTGYVPSSKRGASLPELHSHSSWRFGLHFEPKMMEPLNYMRAMIFAIFIVKEFRQFFDLLTLTLLK